MDASDTDFVQTRENLISGSADGSANDNEQMTEMVSHIKNVQDSLLNKTFHIKLNNKLTTPLLS